jgi:hypothetical protein
MPKRQTQEEILERYREAMMLSKSEMAAALGTSRQSYYLWLDGTEIREETLQEWAVRQRENRVGTMAIELLKSRKADLPCVCKTQTMDNGFCPKHSKTIYTVMA